MLDKLRALTRQRSIDALDETLVLAIAALLPVVSTVRLIRPLMRRAPNRPDALFSIVEADAGRFANPKRTVGTRPSDEPLALALAGKQAGRVEDDSSPSDPRWLFPIASRGRRTAVLEFSGASEDPARDSFTATAVDIYRNQLALLDEMQRDVLTGLLNRQTFDLHLGEILEQVRTAPETPDDSAAGERRHFDPEQSAWLGVIDIDHFKQVNDRFGHLYGDEVLILFARLMQSCFRESDLLFRYGGEEFVALLAPTSRGHALQVFERFRKRVRNYPFPQVGTITTSIGMAEVGRQNSPSELVGQADQALYEAKHQGRDRVLEYAQLVNDEAIPHPETGKELDLDLF